MLESTLELRSLKKSANCESHDFPFKIRVGLGEKNYYLLKTSLRESKLRVPLA